jgi:AraC-like DNA-binding protein
MHYFCLLIINIKHKVDSKMDKNRILYDKKKQLQAHRMPKGMRPVHREYGLWICHVGGSASPSGSFYSCEERYFEYFSISHCHDGGGRLWLPPDYDADISPGQCVITPPHQVNRYGGTDKPYAEDSVCFAGPVADQMFQSGIIGCGVFDFGSARRLLHIGELVADPSKDAQLEANFELQRVLFDVWRRNRTSAAKESEDPIIQLQNEMRENLSRWWTVNEMAEYCYLSDDQFRRRFVKRTGMKPKEYLDRIKMQQAAELLVNSSRSIADTAEQLGYLDPFHFSRRFKAVIGMSPKQYRLQFGG